MTFKRKNIYFQVDWEKSFLLFINPPPKKPRISYLFTMAEDYGIGSLKINDYCNKVQSPTFAMVDEISVDASQLDSLAGFSRPKASISSGSPFTIDINPVGKTFLQLNKV